MLPDDDSPIDQRAIYDWLGFAERRDGVSPSAISADLVEQAGTTADGLFPWWRVGLALMRKAAPVEEPRKSGTGGGGQRGGEHLIIKGLVQELPEIGSDWASQDRMNWLRLAANAFNPIYKGTARIKIEDESTS